jgi:lysyl-tRNA synthetase class II
MVELEDIELLAKALREPPDKHHGITDPGTAYRHRELDLLAGNREVFQIRSDLNYEIRMWLHERNYVEVETPVLQSVYGGATARPFVTKHNALGQEYFLSISSELYLKRALVGGFDRVFTFGRSFRNEGVSPEHNPEFTNLEIFATCETEETMARMTEELLRHLWHKFADSSLAGNLLLDRRMRLASADWPLTRKYATDPSIALAWELFLAGTDFELASGANDLNDPVEQTERLKGVWESADDEGYNPYDENYIEALEVGLLPVSGVGIGIDRLMMVLTGAENIRDVIMFPTLKSDREQHFTEWKGQT